MSTTYQDIANSFQGSGMTTDTVQSNIEKLSLPFAQAYANTAEIIQNSRNVLRTSCNLDSSLAAFFPTVLPSDQYDIEGVHYRKRVVNCSHLNDTLFARHIPQLQYT